jgi:putative oxidoreductase
MNYFENACLLSGRTLMGLYFILPAITKITGFENMSAYMAAHNVPMVPVLLVMTIVIQLSAGSALILGFKGKWAAFLLAGLVLVISLFMHNFWDYADGTERAHELQNFFKNMGIVAGLLVMAALGTGRFSLDQRLSS